MRKNRKAQVFRKNDLIQIKNPEFFVRCGYPICLKDKINELDNCAQYKEKLSDFMCSVGLAGKVDNDIFGNEVFRQIPYNTPDIEYKITKEIAYGLLRKIKFGGDERKIYTKTISELKDKVFRVFGKRIVNTGTRISGSSNGGWDLDFDYDPPYLSNQKSHVILEIWDQYCLYKEFDKYYNLKSDHVDLFNIKSKYLGDSGSILEIEENNVELYKELEENKDEDN